MSRTKIGILMLALLLGAAGLAWVWCSPAGGEQAQDVKKSRLGLMTSLPIYWSESADLGKLLAQDQAPHWVRETLQQRHDLVLLDSLSAPDSAQPSDRLASLKMVALMQPRALSPAEFAALDQWVNEGGRLLLFADPMLTEHSEFALGDKRRPQAVSLLSPILTRWGLAQYFAEDQPVGQRQVGFGDSRIDVEQSGYFEIKQNGTARCVIKSQGLIADCAVGQGYALIVSDAALINADNGTEGAKHALQALLSTAFSSRADQ